MATKRVKKKGASINRVGDAVTPSRRDPDIGKMIKEVKVPTKLAKGGKAKAKTKARSC
jgi:hypothetical protein